jgi:hypothetical protein
VAATPHPTNGIAGRISRLEASRWPDVMIWKPLTSASGKWEAAGPGWTIIEADPVQFADALEKRLNG